MKVFAAVTVICLMAVFTSSCAHSVAKLKRDDDLRHQVLKACVSKGVDAKGDQSCINATKAQAEVAGDSIKEMFQ